MLQMKIKEMARRWLCILLVVVGMLGLLPNTAYAVRQNREPDPAPNTAPLFIEQAIAKGLELVGRTSYMWGGGRSESGYNADPPHLDCSSFVHWAYNRGAGMWIGEKESHANNYGTVGTTRTFKNACSNYIVNVTRETAQRGDLVYLNNGGHIVIWLGTDAQGQGIMLHSGGGFGGMSIGQIDPKGGVAITSDAGFTWDGVAIRLTPEASCVFEGKQEPLRDGSVTGTDGGGTTDGSEDDGTGFVSFNPFVDRNTASNVRGVDVGDRVFSGGAIAIINAVTEWVYTWFMRGATFMSAGLMTYTALAVLWYFAFLPRNGVKGMDMFEKFTGMSAMHSAQATKELFGRFTVTFILMLFFMTGLYVEVMRLIYEALLYVFR